MVLGWQDRDIDEAFELRMLLEPYAAGLAASHASDAQIEELERLNQAMQDAVRSAAPTACSRSSS